MDFAAKRVVAKPDADSEVSIAYDKLVIAVGAEPATFGGKTHGKIVPARGPTDSGRY